jgi:BNR repeat-like domain
MKGHGRSKKCGSAALLTWLLACVSALGEDSTAAGDGPLDIRHVTVYAEEGRFAGWPANHGIWSWDNEILVGFSRGFDRDNGRDYHIDPDRPEDFLLARSRDGGASWSIEQAPAELAGTPGMRHGTMPPGVAPPPPFELRAPIDFAHADFALKVQMESHQGGTSSFCYSYDRGKTWHGPHKLPLFGQKGIMGRTDYVVDGPRRCLLFLTATKSDGSEGRPITVQTADGGRTWTFLSYIGPEPHGYAVMPSTMRVAQGELVTTIRMRDFPRRWIDAYISRDNGRSWTLLSTAVPDTGEGNPPSLVRLNDGRLCLAYGVRAAPFEIRACVSSDLGKTWGEAFRLRGTGGSQDIGYARSVVRPDGRVVTVYAFHERPSIIRGIYATIWQPAPR